MDPTTLVMLDELHDAMTARADAFGATLDPDGYVFSDDPAGRAPWVPGTTRKRLRPLRQGRPRGRARHSQILAGQNRLDTHETDGPRLIRRDVSDTATFPSVGPMS